MKQRTLKGKMMGLIALMLVLLIFTCGFAFWSIARLNTRAVAAIGRMADAIDAHQVTIHALQSYQTQADTIINQNSDGKEFAANIKELTDAVKKFCEMADTAEEKSWGSELEKNLGKFNEIYAQEILPRVAKIKTIKDPVEKQKIMDEICDADGRTDAVLKVIQVDAQKGIDSMVKEANSEKAQCQQQVSQVKSILAVISVAMMVLGVTLGMWIVRGVNNSIKQIADTLSAGAGQTVSAARQVSSASQSLAEGASEQAASLEETSSSLEEMSSMTRRNAESAKNAKELANATKAAADAGAHCVRTMGESMDRIQASSDEMRKAMGAVKDSNNEVAKIIKTIDEIAFQTNILALNAAVEAARAGEAGMGFAVVADEVRNLAQKSAAAARETTSKIEAAISRTEAGVRVSEKVVGDLKTVVEQSRQVEESLKGIEQKSSEVDSLVKEIAAASLEQSQGIEQVNTAVNQMDRVTQSNAANAEESASAAEELNAQAETLNEAVQQLKQIVDGNGAAQATSKTVRASKAAHERGSAARQSGAGPAIPRPAIQSTAPVLKGGEHKAIPMEHDFKDF